MDELKPCPVDEVGKLIEAVAQTLDKRCATWKETLDRAYKEGKYNQNTGLWEVDEYRVERARYTLDAYRDALNLVDTLGSQIDNLRRAAPENSPLTCDGCKYENKIGKEYPCVRCKRRYGDHYAHKPEEEK